MVTGDNLITARSIAKKCGILSETGDGGNVLEGKTFHKLVHDDNGQVRGTTLRFVQLYEAVKKVI